MIFILIYATNDARPVNADHWNESNLFDQRICCFYYCYSSRVYLFYAKKNYLFSFDWFSRDRKDNVDVEEDVNETEREREKKQ